jgi:hypothetical protein
MVTGAVDGKTPGAKVMVSLIPAWESAQRSVPGPLSSVLVTVSVVGDCLIVRTRDPGRGAAWMRGDADASNPSNSTVSTKPRASAKDNLDPFVVSMLPPSQVFNTLFRYL